MSSIGDNIKKLRESADYSQEQLGEKIGKTRSAISQYEAGKIVPRMGVIETLASVFGVQKSEILGDNPLLSSIGRPVEGMAMAAVPIRRRVHAGALTEMDDLVERGDTVLIPQFLLDQDPRCWAAESEGDCMNNIYPEGCIYVISPGRPHQNGKPEVWTIDGMDSVARRAYKTADTLLLSPDSTNPENRDIIIKAEDDHYAEYEGRIVWFQSNGEVE